MFWTWNDSFGMNLHLCAHVTTGNSYPFIHRCTFKTKHCNLGFKDKINRMKWSGAMASITQDCAHDTSYMTVPHASSLFHMLAVCSPSPLASLPHFLTFLTSHSLFLSLRLKNCDDMHICAYRWHLYIVLMCKIYPPHACMHTHTHTHTHTHNVIQY